MNPHPFWLSFFLPLSKSSKQQWSARLHGLELKWARLAAIIAMLLPSPLQKRKQQRVDVNSRGVREAMAPPLPTPHCIKGPDPANNRILIQPLRSPRWQECIGPSDVKQLRHTSLGHMLSTPPHSCGCGRAAALSPTPLLRHHSWQPHFLFHNLAPRLSVSRRGSLLRHVLLSIWMH